MNEIITSIPDPRRRDARFVLVSTWRVDRPDRQEPAAQAALADWLHRPWPRGLLAHSVLLGTEGHTVLHYSQWTGEDAAEEFRRTGRSARNTDIDAVAGGIERVEATGYRLYRSAVPAEDVEPGVVVLVTFDTASASVGEGFVDALLSLSSGPALGGPPTGMRANHFHLAVNGSRVLNWAEFADEAAHQLVVEDRLGEDDEVPALIERTPGLTPLGFRRYLPYGTAVPG